MYQVPAEAEEGVRSLGAGVIDSLKPFEAWVLGLKLRFSGRKSSKCS